MSIRADRSTLKARIFPLGHEPLEDLSDTTTPSERLAMVWDLSREAWALTGLPVPTYERHEIPVRMIPLSKL